MSFDWDHWIKVYEDTVDDPPIRYTKMGSFGLDHDKSERFQKISRELQQRTNPHINQFELRQIGKWKTGGNRIDHHLKENDRGPIITQSGIAFNQSTTDGERIQHLRKLKGVSVPLASAILSVYDPTKYAVIDFRTIRALPMANPRIVDTSNYDVISGYASWLLNYREDEGVYEEYNAEIQNIAIQQNMTPREVDMALWVFDRDNS